MTPVRRIDLLVPPPLPQVAAELNPPFAGDLGSARSVEGMGAPDGAGAASSAASVTVLIRGETGVGKEVLARRIHAQSSRRNAPFVTISCAALPELLLESELFGFERGAFAGADVAKPGLFEVAEGGTLFLDEIGEMSLATQAKLIRALETRRVRRLGSVTERPVDVRVIAATHADLREVVRSNRFRADLYHRVQSLAITVPPLRERRSEIRVLATELSIAAAEKLARPVPLLGEAVLSALEAHDWPGNVRELRNVIDRLVLFSRAGMTEVADLPDELRLRRRTAVTEPAAPIGIREGRPSERPTTRDLSAAASAAPASLDDELGAIERAHITRALEETRGNQSRAAEKLGITRRVLARRMRHHGIPSRYGRLRLVPST